MERRFALVALWALFAAAAVGVGFGAAGLVGDPFTDGGGVGPAAAAPSSTSASTSPSPSPSASRSSSAPRTSAGGTPAERKDTRSTRGGLVTVTCRAGLVSLSASPALGWEIDDLDAGPDQEARVKFERVDDGEGRVEVRASCVGGAPRTTVRDDDSSGPGGDDD